MRLIIMNRKIVFKTKLMLRKAIDLYKKMLFVLSFRKTLRKRDLPNRDIVADCYVRYAFKKALIAQGLLKMPTHETLHTWEVHFFNYETFVVLFNEIFLYNEYLLPAAGQAPFIIDCGSNIGMSILYFKMLYPNAKILAFEPDDATFRLLEKNVDGNGLKDVAIYNCALYSRDGEIDFYYDTNLAGSLLMSTCRRDSTCFRDNIQESLTKVGMPNTGKRVKSVMLSSYITGPVDLLKMDIEGSEHVVIDELARSGKLRLIKKMVVEYHHNMHPDQPGLAGFLGVLEQNRFGYQVRASHPNFNAGTGKFQNIIIFAYNQEMTL
jgi:FkbM family methyltransferase